MLDRRTLLAGAAALAPAAAQAQRRSPRGHPPAPAPAAPTGAPATTPLGPLDTSAKWALILDFNSGATLLDKDGDAPMPPSSMTKLMTMYIVYGMLKSGRLTLEQQLPVSEKAWRMQGSKMFVPIGETVKVEDLVRGVIVQSGNDACIVFAEAIAGSEEQFVDLMNQKAKELGLSNSQFRNCTGWPDPEQHMSCRDIASLAKHLIQDFPQYYHYDSEKSFKYNGIEQENRNPLVQKGLADGLKTGHTDAGGYGLVASAARSGRRVIVVLNGLTSMKQRREESERLLEWAFREFEDVTLFTAADTVENARVWLGSQPTVPLVGGQDLVITMPKQWRKSATIEVQYESPIAAPVSRGEVLGKLIVPGRACRRWRSRCSRGSMCRGSACPGGRWRWCRATRSGPERGLFITLEGGEGAGKSTQAALLADRIASFGRPALRTRSLAARPGREALRAMLLRGAVKWSAVAEAHLHFAARAEHLAHTIMPALEAGMIVVCDRFADSTMAYQGFGLGADRALIAGLTRLLPVAPALTLLLTVPPAIGAARTAARPGRPDRYEALNAGFHARVAAGYATLAAAAPERFEIVDGDGDVEVVHARIWDAVEKRFP